VPQLEKSRAMKLSPQYEARYKTDECSIKQHATFRENLPWRIYCVYY